MLNVGVLSKYFPWKQMSIVTYLSKHRVWQNISWKLKNLKLFPVCERKMGMTDKWELEYFEYLHPERHRMTANLTGYFRKDFFTWTAFFKVCYSSQHRSAVSFKNSKLELGRISGWPDIRLIYNSWYPVIRPDIWKFAGYLTIFNIRPNHTHNYIM